MTTHKNKVTVNNNSRLFGRCYIRFVKKANMWCKTTFDENGKQIQKWAGTKEEL